MWLLKFCNMLGIVFRAFRSSIVLFRHTSYFLTFFLPFSFGGRRRLNNYSLLKFEVYYLIHFILFFVCMWFFVKYVIFPVLLMFKVNLQKITESSLRSQSKRFVLKHTQVLNCFFVVQYIHLVKLLCMAPSFIYLFILI